MTGWALESDLRRTAGAVRETRERIAPHIRQTPLIESDGRLLKLETPPAQGVLQGARRRRRDHRRGGADARSSPPRPATTRSPSRWSRPSSRIACRIFVPAGVAPAKLARLRGAGVSVALVDGDPLAAELEARRARGALARRAARSAL